MFEISLSIVGVVFSIVVSCCSFLYGMIVCGTIVVFILRTMTKSLIIVDWFERSPVTYCYIIAHVRNTHPCRSCVDKLDLRKRSVFLKIWRKRCLVVYTFFDLLSLIYCIGYSATVVYRKMQTMCTLYERHTCSMCMHMRNKTAQQCRNCRYNWSSM